MNTDPWKKKLNSSQRDGKEWWYNIQHTVLDMNVKKLLALSASLDMAADFFFLW